MTEPAPSLFALRTRDRPQPRFGSALAVAGALLSVAGLLVWTVTYYVQGQRFGVVGIQGYAALQNDGILYGNPSSNAPGDDRKWLGFALFLALVVIGVAVSWWRKRGPLAAAGSVAAALAIPLTMAFATLQGIGLFIGVRVQIDSVFLVSIIAWLIGYVAVPGMRGRAFLLTLALVAIVGYGAIKIAGSPFETTTTVRISGAGPGPSFGEGVGFGGLHPTDNPGTHAGALAALGLAVGLFYYAVAALLDVAARAGVSVAFVVAGFVTLATGLFESVRVFPPVGAGVAALLIGALLAAYGARSGRRFTAWSWLVVAGVGVGAIVAQIVPDRAVAAGITLLIIGILVAVGSQVGSSFLHERPEYPEIVG